MNVPLPCRSSAERYSRRSVLADLPAAEASRRRRKRQHEERGVIGPQATIYFAYEITLQHAFVPFWALPPVPPIPLRVKASFLRRGISVRKRAVFPRINLHNFGEVNSLGYEPGTIHKLDAEGFVSLSAKY